MSSAREDLRVTLADGREVDVCTYGAPSGRPLFHLHGTPGSRLQSFFDADVYARNGFRAVMFDRSGYARSRRSKGRSVADGAKECIAVADALGLDRFAVLGVSGGAPLALGAAALLPERVMAVASIVGPAPRRSPEDDAWFDGMSADQSEEMRAAADGEDALRPVVERLAAVFADAHAKGRLPPPPGATEPVAMPAPVAAHVLRWQREALSGGIDGWIDDDLALVRPWGVDLAAVRAPALIWAADEDDCVPVSHAVRLGEALPHAELVRSVGGHLAFIPHVDAILRTVADRVR